MLHGGVVYYLDGGVVGLVLAEVYVYEMKISKILTHLKEGLKQSESSSLLKL